MALCLRDDTAGGVVIDQIASRTIKREKDQEKQCADNRDGSNICRVTFTGRGMHGIGAKKSTHRTWPQNTCMHTPVSART
jgi:hypothetical protein